MLIARRYERSGCDILDLIQEGSIRLMRAAENYDHTLGYRFASYADLWIKKGIQRGVMEDRLVPLPEEMVERLNKINRVSRDIVQALGREPEAHEIAAKTGLTTVQVENTINSIAQIVSIHAPVDESDGDMTLGDTLADKSASPLEHTEAYDSGSKVDQILAALTPKRSSWSMPSSAFSRKRSHKRRSPGSWGSATRACGKSSAAR